MVNFFINLLMYRKYLLYEAIDFLADEDFKSWVIGGKSDDELSQHWQKVAECLPEKRQAMLSAEESIEKLQKGASAEHRRMEIWEAIEREMAVNSSSRPKTGVFGYLGKGYWAAASLLILCTLAVVFWPARPGDWEEVTTGHGPIRKVLLPDSSVVYLGAHSGVRFLRSWLPGQIREVWLSGNGFLDVRHLNSDPAVVREEHRFVVHTPGGPDIRVLGTAFEVKSREKEVAVELISGSVELAAGRNVQRMSPGERVVFGRDGQFVKQPQPSGIRVGWETGEMYFQNTTLQEAAARIGELFGVEIVIRTPGLLHRRLEGSIPCDSPDAAVLALRDILNMTLYKKGDLIYMQ